MSRVLPSGPRSRSATSCRRRSSAAPYPPPIGTDEIASRIAALDETLFDAIESQTTVEDRRSLLALHAAAAQVAGSFDYLEIGSHLGGSLQVLVRDPRCERIVSIDSRPRRQPDARGTRQVYGDNSAARMIGLLDGIEGAAVAKVRAIDASTAEVDPATLPGEPSLIFVDGEHTDQAALQDGRFGRRVLGKRGGVIAFHDCWIVYRGVRAFLEELGAAGTPHRALLLPESVIAIELGEPRLLETEPVRAQAERAAYGYLGSLERQGLYRDVLDRRLPRLLRRLRLIRLR